MRHRTLGALLATIGLTTVLFATSCAPAESPPSSTSPVVSTRPAEEALPAPPAQAEPPIVFAVIGDYGTDDSHERDVAELVASWDPEFIIATGDDYYADAGGKGTGRYDESTGAYYGKWLKDITTTGKRYPVGSAEENAFFPSLGNHDYSDAKPGPETYLKYFDLPGSGFDNSSGNERYYDFVQGPIHFFVLNSNPEEPDGTSSTSTQAKWLKEQLDASDSPWNIVYDHHPPYSSDSKHGSTGYMRWPYAEWGADVVISGHSHTYERIMRHDIVYFVNGLGGRKRYEFGEWVKGSESRYNSNWGAQRVTATADELEFEFYSISGRLKDRHRIVAQPTQDPE